LVLGFLSLFLVAVGAISGPPPCLISGSGQIPAGFTCHFSYPDGGAPLVLSASEFLVLLVGSVVLVLVSSIALFYSFSRSANSLVGPSGAGTSPISS
jgi:hypothetical protein